MCCVVFAHLTSNITTGALVKLPMKKWNKATGILNNHQKKEYHITASLRADDFLQTAERLKTSITSIIDNEAVDILRKTENFTKNKASGLANAISSFSFIITLLTAMKCLSILKPLSVKLQKRDLDVYEAYTISNVTDDLQDIRENIEDIWTEWFDLAVTTAANVGVVFSILRRTNQQQHRDNVPAQTPSDYYKRAVAIPLLDHLQSEMKTYFNPTNDAVLSSLFNLLPELVAVGDRNPDIEAALEFYENDLPSPHVVDVELLRWKRKWCSTEDADLPTSAVQTRSMRSRGLS